MSQLMRDQLLAAPAFGIVFTTSEKRVVTGRESSRMDGNVKAVGLSVVMHSDCTEVCAEGMLHARTKITGQGLTVLACSLDALFDVGRYPWRAGTMTLYWRLTL